jgi:hypothetical protein
MPRYTWFFRPAAGGAPPAPNRAGFSIIAYVQWLGTWPRTKVEGEGAQQ